LPGEVKVSDVLGVAAFGEAVKEVTASAVSGMGALLSRICLPAAEAFGWYWGERVKLFGARNLAAIARATEEKLNSAGEGHSAHPRVVARVLTEGAWVDDPDLQAMWGGLLASACTEDGLDDSNVLFQDLLSGLTGLQARILKYACEGARKFVSGTALVLAEQFTVRATVLSAALGVSDIDRLDRELDRLVAIGLLTPQQGFNAMVHGPDGLPEHVGVTPSPLALHLFVRCQGSRLSPIQYFAVSDRRVGAPIQQFSQPGVLWHPADVKPDSKEP
jgi:hypothetical protein